MSRKFQLFFCVILIILSGCMSPVQPEPERVITTSTPDLQATGTARVYASWTEMYQTLTATPLAASAATKMPVLTPQEPTPTVLLKLLPGQPLTLTNLHMNDAVIGWGIESSGHILRTRDGGRSWQDVTPPQGVYNEGGFFALDAETAWATPFQAACYLAECPPFFAYGVIFRTEDGGATWQASQPICLTSSETCPYDYDVQAEYYSPVQMQFLDQKLGWLLVTVKHAMFLDRYRLYHTSDGGQTWNFVTGSLGGPMVSWATGLAFLDEQVGWFSFSQVNGAEEPRPNWEVYRSQDGGRTWNLSKLPVPDSLPGTFAQNMFWCGASKLNVTLPQTIDLTFYCDVYEANARPRYYFQFHSFDGGENWYSWQTSGNGFFLDAQVGWQLSAPTQSSPPQELQRTTDGGQTWLTIKTVTWQEAQFDFVSAEIGWALARHGEASALVHTTDGGLTWEYLKPISAP